MCAELNKQNEDLDKENGTYKNEASNFIEDNYSSISRSEENSEVDTSLLQQIVQVNLCNNRNSKLNNYRAKIYSTTYENVSKVKNAVEGSIANKTTELLKSLRNKKGNDEKFCSEKLWSESNKNSFLKPKSKLKIYNKKLAVKLQRFKSLLNTHSIHLSH